MNSVRIDAPARRREADGVPWRERTWAWLAERVGMWDYWRRPQWRASCNGAFNGQAFRQRLFIDLCTHVPFVAIVETGTHRGTTTQYFRRVTRQPIHSFEINPRKYGFARVQLMSLPDVRLHRCDSRVGLRNLAASKVLPPGPVFFYLDAHWFDDLPLAQEITLAFAHWAEAVVMIDDFAVPDDPGYRFDSYGSGQALTLGYLRANAVLPAGVWFPRCASAAETGARRGCVVLAGASDVSRRIDTVGTLRRWRVPARVE